MNKTDQKPVITSIGNYQHPTFLYEEYGIMGVGKSGTPIISMDKYIDTSMNNELHNEILLGLSRCKTFNFGRVLGSLPPEDAKKYQSDFFAEILLNIKDYDPTGIHSENLNKLTTWEERTKYTYFAMGAVIPWFFTLYLRRQSFIDKSKQILIDRSGNKTLEWEPEANLFPLLKKYLMTLPLKSIGRVMFFTTFPNVEVPTHRDFVVAPHKDHNINLFFSESRPSFIYDEIKKEKIYLEKGATSYFFNNRDYHGVDSEPRFRYTLRIDGTFTDELCETLGLEDGYVFKWDYKD